MFDYLVIGNGLIGSAATRYLARASKNVALLGPNEPKDWANHKGVFASHYDQGRITRVLDQDLVWAELASKSIAEYEALERSSGIKFHYAAGCVNVGLAGKDTRSEKTLGVAKALNVTYDHYDSFEATETLPMMHFPEGREVLLEHGAAGYVNPRSLVAAQLKLAQASAQVITAEVKAVVPKSGWVDVLTKSGETYQAKKVLLATGAYTNALLDSPLKFEVKPRTIILAELDSFELERLKGMPSLIFYEGLDSSELAGVYGLPPIKYPDGKFYLKLGGRLANLSPLETAGDLLDWFHSEGSKREAELLRETLFSIVPSLKAQSLTSRPCVITATQHERPYIDELLTDQIFVAAGGNGAAAKSSNEIGRIASQMLLGLQKPDKVFQAVSQ